MSKLALSVIAAGVLCMSMAVAQDTSGSSQGSTGSSAGSQGTTGSSPSMSQGSSSSSSSGTQGGEMKSEKSMKGGKEKTLKGCIKSEGGQYMLEESHGKMVNLTGSDVSGHVGHQVKVHGMYGSGSSDASGASSGSSSMSGSSASMSGGKTFNVTSIDMVSETCKMSSGKDKMSGGSSSGSSTQPPQ